MFSSMTDVLISLFLLVNLVSSYFARTFPGPDRAFGSKSASRAGPGAGGQSIN